MTKAEVAKEFKKLKKENFKTEAEYEKFLKESDFTQADVDSRVELTILSNEIQKQITEGVFGAEPERNRKLLRRRARHPVHPAGNPRHPPRRQQRQSESRIGPRGPEIRQLAEKLEKSREKILRRRTEQVQRRVPERHRRRRPRRTAERRPLQRLRRPGRRAGQDRTAATTSSKSTTRPRNQQELKTVESQIKSQLEQQGEQESFTAFVANYSSKWKSRTFCADGFVIERCANFKAEAHPADGATGLLRREPENTRGSLSRSRLPADPGDARDGLAGRTARDAARPAPDSGRRRRRSRRRCRRATTIPTTPTP